MSFCSYCGSTIPRGGGVQGEANPPHNAPCGLPCFSGQPASFAPYNPGAGYTTHGRGLIGPQGSKGIHGPLCEICSPIAEAARIERGEGKKKRKSKAKPGSDEGAASPNADGPSPVEPPADAPPPPPSAAELRAAKKELGLQDDSNTKRSRRAAPVGEKAPATTSKSKALEGTKPHEPRKRSAKSVKAPAQGGAFAVGDRVQWTPEGGKTRRGTVREIVAPGKRPKQPISDAEARPLVRGASSYVVECRRKNAAGVRLPATFHWPETGLLQPYAKGED